MQRNEKLPDFFTVKELAERWKVTQRHVRDLINEGQIKPTRIGRAVRIAVREVLAYEALRAC